MVTAMLATGVSSCGEAVETGSTTSEWLTGKGTNS